jgi:hypothetical protein
MMEHYVTLFDMAFSPQGLALHQSLQRHAGRHTLWVICMDVEVERMLRQLDLPDVRIIPLAEAEDEALLAAKTGRTRGEYCWTLTPFSFDLVFQRDETAARVTYLDADVWVRSDPSPVFQDFERSGASVQITEHAYSPEYDQTATSGRYCVQFLTMDRDVSDPVRTWWQQRCLEWCFARHEDGKFGDQKYLDDWLVRFPGMIHVPAERGWFQGPWNANRFPYSEAVSYHFHSLRTLSDDRVKLLSLGYRIPSPHFEYVYEPYLDDLRVAVGWIVQSSANTTWIQVPNFPTQPRQFLRTILRPIRRFVTRTLVDPSNDFSRRYAMHIRSLDRRDVSRS